MGMSGGGNAKGGAGTAQPQGMPQGKGGGGLSQYQGANPQQMQQKMQQALLALKNQPAGVGDPRAAQYSAARAANPLGNRPPPGSPPGGIAGIKGAGGRPMPQGMGNAKGAGGQAVQQRLMQDMQARQQMNAAPLPLAAGAPTQAMGPTADGATSFGVPRADTTTVDAANFNPGGALSGALEVGNDARTMPTYAGGGIVGLANGGQLGAPLSRGGVSYGPPTAAPPPAVMAAAPAPIAPVAAAPAWKPTWTPGAATAGNSGIAALPAITQPAAYKAPAQQQAIWQPPAVAAAAAPAKLTNQQIWQSLLAKERQGLFGQQSGGGGGQSHGDRQGYGGRTGGW